jgi:hypothetical protein
MYYQHSSRRPARTEITDVMITIKEIMQNKVFNAGEYKTMLENTNTTENENSRKLMMSSLRIAMSYVDGYSSLKFLFEILELQQNNVEKYLTIPEFYDYLYGICYQSVIINLSNILVEDRGNQSVNIYYLRSFFEKNLQNNQGQEGNIDLYRTIQGITGYYSTTSDFYLGLKELRDKYIAHIDKVRFHSATGLTKKISLIEIKLAYDSIATLVGNLIGILGINPELIDFDQLDKANLQFRLLINDLKSNPTY